MYIVILTLFSQMMVRLYINIHYFFLKKSSLHSFSFFSILLYFLASAPRISETSNLDCNGCEYYFRWNKLFNSFINNPINEFIFRGSFYQKDDTNGIWNQTCINKLCYQYNSSLVTQHPSINPSTEIKKNYQKNLLAKKSSKLFG